MLLKKVVIAEDDDAIAHMVNMTLGDAGFLCLRARDGHEALRLVRMHTPDLLVLDVMMPGLDGLEVARRLRADVLLSKTPVLMLTVKGGVEDKISGLEAGADDYLVKPFDLRELSARASALIRSSRREADRDPTTLLPGSRAIDQHLRATLAGGADKAVLHFAAVGFEAYADQVGYAKSAAFAAALGELLLDITRTGKEGGFLGHLGGVDFIAVVAAPEAEALAQKMIAGFRSRRDAGTLGQPEEVASLVPAVAVVATAGLRAGDAAELATRLAAALRDCKRKGGYVIWRPEAA